MALSDKAQRAIDHARKTTGTLQWCGVGVFSGDGEYSLESNSCRYDTPAEVKRFLEKKCVRFTAQEMYDTSVIHLRRCARYQSLATSAIAQQKWDSAVRLVENAGHEHNKAQEIRKGECVIYRISPLRVSAVAAGKD